MTSKELWQTFKTRLFVDRLSGFSLDTSRLSFSAAFFTDMEPRMQAAQRAMQGLESGEIANPDEKRMVGHYWLRDSDRAPTPAIKSAIDQTVTKIKDFASKIHNEGKFESLLLVGIGGSALGPQFVTQALSGARDRLKIFFFDNTDPDGMSKVLDTIPSLQKTLVIVVSKSGGTKETRNGQFIAKQAFADKGLAFNRHFIAVTTEGSDLDKLAISEGWLERFPMWDWVGGRTSEVSAVGLLPLALQGFSVDQILAGAKHMDQLTRVAETSNNPAALLALSWYHAGSGKGLKDMVVLPYKDRLELFSRYLQQLVMESLGKEHDLSGEVVNQGIAVYGNKGSTDQHAYVQQLRDGVNNFFAVFIEVLKDSSGRGLQAGFIPEDFEVEPQVTCGDFLLGFLLGTRKALFDKGRESVGITVQEVNEFSVGMLIALFERAVGLYAALINVNAYHQPGVEAGKKAAQEVLALQAKVLSAISAAKRPLNVEEIAEQCSEPENVEHIFRIVRHLAANQRLEVTSGDSLFEDRYS